MHTQKLTLPQCRPTTFIPGSHTEEQSTLFAARGQTRDELLISAHAHAANLKAGDAVIFDSRLLHAGTANMPAAQGLCIVTPLYPKLSFALFSILNKLFRLGVISSLLSNSP